jgi:hypothetical protein
MDDVVTPPARDEDREAATDGGANAIEHCFAGSVLHAKELVERVDFSADLLVGLQGHEDQLAVLRRVEHLTKLGVLDGETLDILHETLHGISSRHMIGLSWTSGCSVEHTLAAGVPF